MKTMKYFIMAATALAFAACNNDDENPANAPVEARITAGVEGITTRAYDNVWEQDEIGVMVTAAPSSDMEDLYKNVKYTTEAETSSAATFTAETGKGIFFQDASETVTFAAYGPYQESAANALPGENGLITGSTADQSTNDKQKAIDYIFASGATASRGSSTVEFQGEHAFAHKMTRLVIIVKTSESDGFTAQDVTGGTYTLIGLNLIGTFDVKTGVAKAINEAGTGLFKWSLSDNSLKSITETEQVTFTSILYPQNLGGPLTFTANIDGQTYTNNTIQPDFAAGYSYTYTITVKKTGLTVSGCTIKDWKGDGNSYTGDATMQ